MKGLLVGSTKVGDAIVKVEQKRITNALDGGTVWAIVVLMLVVVLVLIGNLGLSSLWLGREAQAGDKEEFELRLQVLTLQAQNLDLKAKLSVCGESIDLNKRVQELQKELATKGLTISQDGKIVEKPEPIKLKAEPPKEK
jgi:hypothetical protein